MTEEKGDLLGFLRNWRTPGELKNRFGIQNPEAYFSQMEAEGYGMKKEKREVGLFQVLCYKWDGTWKKIVK